MRILLFILAVATALMGFATEVMAKAVTHEILGGVFFIIAAVLFGSAAIVDAIVQLTERLGTAGASEPPAPREAAINAKALDALVDAGTLHRH